METAGEASTLGQGDSVRVGDGAMLSVRLGDPPQELLRLRLDRDALAGAAVAALPPFSPDSEEPAATQGVSDIPLLWRTGSPLAQFHNERPPVRW